MAQGAVVRHEDRANKGYHQSNPLTTAASRSRGALLIGASLIALAALGARDAAQAACVSWLQTISRPVAGQIISNGGTITVTGAGSAPGQPDGVDALDCPLATLDNHGGITGGSGAAGGQGGAAVSNAGLNTTLTHGGGVSGGAGALDFGLSGVAPEDYGALDVTGQTSLAGGIGMDGFTLMAGDSFDLLMSGGAFTGDFTRLAADGVASSAKSADIRLGRSSRGGPGSLDPSGATIPESSSFAMMLLGFAGLGYTAFRRSARVRIAGW